MHFRPHEAPVSEPLPGRIRLRSSTTATRFAAPPTFPPLRLLLHGDEAGLHRRWRAHRASIFYRVEASRGYESHGVLWSPGYFRVDLRPASRRDAGRLHRSLGHDRCALSPRTRSTPSANAGDALLALADPAGAHGPRAELVLAADQFIITPPAASKMRRARSAAGDEVRTVIAGYHWFTDWGRDTMISLEGLTLTTGRHARPATSCAPSPITSATA